MIELTAKNEADAKTEAVEISKKNPDKYVTVSAVFGLFASLADRLNTFAPSDSAFKWYARNGKIKRFTNSQNVADQNATPNTF